MHIIEKQFDIIYNVDIRNIYRNSQDVTIHYEDVTSNSFVQKCGFLIWTPPMPELLKHASYISLDEYQLFKSLSPHVYSASLMRATNTKRNNPIAYYSETVSNKINHGVTVELDIEGALNYDNKNVTQYNEMVKHARIITVLQLGRSVTNKNKINGIAKNHYKLHLNSTNIDIFNTITWPYMYKWAPHEVSRGNHWKVLDLQGHHRTWYAGASVCFESVKSVLEYNNLLLRNLGNIK